MCLRTNSRLVLNDKHGDSGKQLEDWTASIPVYVFLFFYGVVVVGLFF